ncbi:nitroreductase [Membranicola marinus]|uniref:Putative NAD(P)H nitroreductase n=1 Tax=Membranihabitans marinus TaxID=1227546 RepID=A0A953LBM4_9BACT|nr:nitroreductase [Membranihabitans marinus]MBY5956804.1 nitroreductase [Membranihabitans marinus]
MNDVLKAVSRRRAIYPDRFNNNEITQEQVRELLEAARFAPTHKLTEPWRFHVLMGDSKHSYADKIKTFVEDKTNKPEKGDRMKEKMDQSQAVIVISYQRDPRERVPEWEEIAATAMAVQNIWIHTQALGMGGYWSTGAPAVEALTRQLSLEPGEKILGLFFLGRHDHEPRQRPSKSVDEFTTWLT